MMTNPLTSIFRKKSTKLLLISIVAILVVLKFAPSIIDTKPFEEKLVSELQAITGADVSIGGATSITLLPQPSITFRDIKVTKYDVAGSPVITIGFLDALVSFSSMVESKPQLSRLALDVVNVDLQRDKKGDADWGFLGVSLLKKFSASQGNMDIDLRRGKVVVAEDKNHPAREFIDLFISGKIADKVNLLGVVNVGGELVNFNLSRTGKAGVTPFVLSAQTGNGQSASLNGTIDMDGDVPVIEAKFEASSDNIASIFLADSNEVVQKSKLDVVQNKEKEEEKPKDPVVLPVKITADYAQKQGAIQLSNIQLESGKTKGKGVFIWNFSDKSEQIITLDLDTLDAENIREFIQGKRRGDAGRSLLESVLSDNDQNVTMSIKAKDVLFRDQTWHNAVYRGVVADGAMTVNQLSLGLQGNSKISLFGLVSYKGLQGLRFEGNSEASGDSLRDLLTIFDESASSLPEIGFDKFRVSANLFISSEQLRLSEADMLFSQMALKGGLVAYFDKKPRIEADVLLRDINFDHIRDAWREQAVAKKSKEYFIKVDNTLQYEWLKKLATSIDFKVDVVGFRFLERAGKRASFRLFAQEGEFGIYNAKFYYDTDTTEVNFTLDVKGEKPNINLALNTKEFTTEYFAVIPKKHEEKIEEPSSGMLEEDILLPEFELPSAPVGTTIHKEEGDKTELVVEPQAEVIAIAGNEDEEEISQALKDRWSQDLLDMSWMENLNGKFDLSIGALIHRGKRLQNFKMSAKLDRNLLLMQALTFVYWNGSFSINGALYGGKVPGMTMGFVLASADVRSLLGELFGVKSMNGKVSVSGTVETSGVNLLSWATQANAQFQFAARGVSIKNFDLNGALNAVTASRTAADTFNNVNISLVRGTGEYSIDGTINVREAMMSTAGFTMKTGRILGNIKGDLSLIPWTITMDGLFQFPQLSSDTVPTLAVKWEGDVVSPSMQVDTQSLEAFVSKRITGN